MAGGAIVQRPELWRAVIPRVPLLDVIAACRSYYASWSIEIEFGDPDCPEDLARMLSYSPYQNIKNGVNYPAVFIDCGANDIRCPAWHARKFFAALQYSSASERPILVNISEEAGHGAANTREVQLKGDVAWMAFLLQELGMTVPSISFDKR